MSSDLDASWLRNVANYGRGSAMTEALHLAADEIERLRFELGLARSLILGQRVGLGVDDGASFVTALDVALKTDAAIDRARGKT